MKLLLSITIVSVLLLFTTPIHVSAETGDYPDKFMPKVQVKINVGNTELEDSAFLTQLIAALKAKGIEISKVDVGYAGNVETDFSVTEPSNWTMYDHFGNWGERDSIAGGHYPAPDANPDADSPVNPANDPHIIIHDDGSVAFYGYGSPAYKDFMLSKDDTSSDKHFKFDMDGSKVDYHSMEGGGFLFGVAVDDKGTADVTTDDTMSGYAVLFTSGNTKLYKLLNVNVNNFHKETSYTMGSMSGISTLTSGSKDTGSTIHSIQIDIVDNKLTVKDNAVVAIDDFDLTVIGNQFGPLVSYGSHGCSTLSYFIYDNLKMGTTIKIVSKAQDNVGTVEWSDGSYPVYINLEDTNDATLDPTTFVNALKADGTNYIGVGLTASKAMHDAIIAANGKGKYYEFTSYPQDPSTLANSIADYIWPLLEPVIIDTIKNTEITHDVDSSLILPPTIIIPNDVVDTFDDLVANHNVRFKLTIDPLDALNVSVEEQTLITAYLSKIKNKEATGFIYMDLSLVKILDEEQSSDITQTDKPITISIVVPENMRTLSEFKIVRLHNGVLEVLPSTYDPATFTLTFSTTKFSTYGLQFTNPSMLPDTGENGNAGILLILMSYVLFLISRKTSKI